MTRRRKSHHRPRRIPEWQQRVAREHAERQVREWAAARPDPVEMPVRPLTIRLLALLAVVGMGTMAGTGLAALVSYQAEHRALAEGRSVTARIVAVVNGEPLVSFATADGAEVTTIALGSHRHGGPRDIVVRHLPEDPAVAATEDHTPRPWWAVALAALAATALGSWYFPGSLRDAHHRRRARAHEDGAERTSREAWRRVLPWAAPAVGLAVAAACAVPLAAAAPYPALISAGVLGTGALTLGARALLLHAEHAPAPRPPSPIRLLPRWTGAALCCAVFLSVPVGFAAHGLTGLFLEHRAFNSDDVATGTAEILAEEKVGGRGPCRWSADLRFTADGLTYEQRVTEYCSDNAADLLRGAAEATVEWPTSDPTRVRVVAR